MYKQLLSFTLAGMLLTAAACEREQAASQAETGTGEQAQQSPEDDAADTEHTIHGRVTAVNQDTGEVTIDHEPVDSLGWPAMVMPFPVRDSALLEGIDAGDSVTFTVIENDRGEYVIEELRKSEAQ